MAETAILPVAMGVTSLNRAQFPRDLGDAHMRSDPYRSFTILKKRSNLQFRKLWTLYLAYCETGFAERRICDLQLLLAKPRSRIASRTYRKRSDHSQQPDLSLSA